MHPYSSIAHCAGAGALPSNSEAGLPAGQLNAHPGDELMVRIGVPHRGGRLASHAFAQGYPAMVSASAFWNRRTSRFVLPDHSNIHELDFALDSAGFTVARIWKKSGPQKGLGRIFPWTLAQYMGLAFSCGAVWWSQPDLCCEPEIASSREEVDFRVHATATFLEASLQQLYAWQSNLAKDLPARVVANMLWPCVPVLQGWQADDYRRSLDLLMRVWGRWQPWVAPPALIGIGSVCRRSLHHPTHGLYAILRALDGQLHAGTKAHLFGVKGAGLSQFMNIPRVASVDSMAYDFTERVNAHRRGHSNTMEGRTQAMTHWMEKIGRAIRPAGGKQGLLPL